MKPNLQKLTRLSTLILTLVTVLFVLAACGSDDPKDNTTTNNPNNTVNITNGKITLEYDGKTFTTTGESTGVTMPVMMGTMFTQTNAKWEGADDKNSIISAKVILKSDPAKTVSPGVYNLYREDDLPSDGSQVGTVVIGGDNNIFGSDIVLESISGTAHLESIKLEGNKPKIATYHFDGSFQELSKPTGPTYKLSGDIVFVFKQAATP